MKSITNFTYPLLLLFLLFLPSCKNSSEEMLDSLYSQDSLKMGLDSIHGNSDNLVNVPDTIKVISHNAVVQDRHEANVKKYGVQWDFCKCVVKSDSINKALMSASGDEFDKLLERSDYIDKKCKDLFISPQRTPSQRAKHKQRVQNCLRNAGH